MPGGDRTGPMGAGRLTGRGAGFCAGYGEPEYTDTFGRGRGCRGYRRRYHSGPAYMGVDDAVPDEKTFLDQRADFLENQLKNIKKRLSDLEDKSE